MSVPDRQRRQIGKRLQAGGRFGWRVYPPHTVAAILAELMGQGVDASAVLAGTGLAPAQIDDHATRISYQQLHGVVRNALHLSNDPALALRAGLRMHVTAYGMYGYALLSCATAAQATEFANLFGSVHGPFCKTTYSTLGDETICVLTPVEWPNQSDDLHRFSIEFALSVHVTKSRDLIGPSFRFSRIALDYAAPPHAGIYETLFECPVLFEQDDCRYAFDSHIGALALADSRTHAMAREVCERLLNDINGARGGVSADLRRLLIEQPGQYPSFERIAGRMGMVPGVLRRILREEGTTYRELLADVRMRLAVEYLRTTHLTVEQIGNQLGYSDGSNFRHAFVRWTGRKPSDFRPAEHA